MLKLILNPPRDERLKVLCLGAHCDDIEIGCGGTLLKLSDHVPIQAHWIVFCSDETRAKEATKSADLFLKNVSIKEVIIRDFRDGFLPYFGGIVKDFFEELKTRVSPDLIFTHYRDDLHQDHHLICELTWNTFRNHLILEYEVPKYDGDLGNPNFFVHLPDSICHEKARILLDAFASQRDKHWFREDTFLSLLRLRGLQSVSPNHYAEGFYCRKACL